MAAAIALFATALVNGPRIRPSLLFSLSIAAAVFSQHADDLGVPGGLPMDRVLFLAGLTALVAGFPFGVPRARKLRWRPVHALMLLTVLIVVMLSLASGAIESERGQFAILDRLGIVPFLYFAVAPLAFGTRRDRQILLVTGVVVGWYLALTAALEAFGVDGLVWPAYINDPTVGLHVDRARGPFAESTAMGLGLLGSGALAIVALRCWRSRAARAAAWLLLPLVGLGCLFTLTRAVWLAAVGMVLVSMVADRSLRRYLVPLLVVGAVAVVVALATVPGLSDRVDERRNENLAVWDRLNTNRAALSAFQDKPLTGVGFGQFSDYSTPYLEQHSDYPLTGGSIEVHNILLSRLAEIGLLGTVPWLGAVVVGLVIPALTRGSPEFEPWRAGLLAYGTGFAIVAMFGPASAAFPNSLLWLLGGIATIPRTSIPNQIGVERPARSEAALTGVSM